MNYKPLVYQKLKEFGDLSPDFSIGELFYSILIKMGKKPDSQSLTWIRELSDDEFYTSLEKNIEDEAEYKLEKK